MRLVLGADIEYSLVRFENSNYYLATKAIERVFHGKDYQIISKTQGKNLERTSYQPLFDYFKDEARDKRGFYVTTADYVDVDTGTGIVHTAPCFGEDDFATGLRYQLPEVMPFDDQGRFNSTVDDFQGLFFKDADPKIIRHLKKRNLIFKHEQIEHSYPFCWRTDAPLMYRTIPSWYLNVEKIKPQLISNNKKN